MPSPSPGIALRLLRGLRGQKRRWPWSAAPPQTAVERPLHCPSLRQRVETSTFTRPRLRPSWRLWEDEDGAAVARGSWLAGSCLAAPPRPGSEAGGAPGTAGAGRAALTPAMRGSRAAPRELQVQHSFLTLLKCQRGLKRAPAFRMGPNHPDSAQPARFPPRKVAAIAPVPTPRWPRSGPCRTALLPPVRSRRDEGPWCSWGARRGHS